MISKNIKIEDFEEKCALLGYYTVSSNNLLPTFWENPSDGGTDRLSRNNGNKLPLLAAY